MKAKLKTVLRSLFGIVLAVLFLYLAIRGTDFDKLWSSLQNVRYEWIVLIIPIGLQSLSQGDPVEVPA